MAFDGRTALSIIEKIGNTNGERQYYLTDAVAIVRDLSMEAVVIETSEDEVRGIDAERGSRKPSRSCRRGCARLRSMRASP